VLELRARLEQPFSAADAQLLQPFVAAATIAIVNARLYEQARLSATLAERNRLGRELHDTIAQGLTAVSMQLTAAQRGFERDPLRAHARVERAATLTRETLEQVRRSVWMLAEPVIEGEALSAALDELTVRFAERTGLHASYRHDGPPPALGHTAATQALRIVQEALHNVEKHAQASQVQVRSRCDEATLRITIEDDGHGFDPATLPAPGSASATNGGGFGLLSLRERARLAGGTVTIESAPGLGSSVIVTLSAER
jgi:signal transduction histidine kinase